MVTGGIQGVRHKATDADTTLALAKKTESPIGPLLKAVETNYCCQRTTRKHCIKPPKQALFPSKEKQKIEKFEDLFDTLL